MMEKKRPIDANKLYDAIEQKYKNSSGTVHEQYRELLDLICDQETLETEVVTHGKWVTNVQKGTFCSECKTAGSVAWKRCPVCEAKMDGKMDKNISNKKELPF